MDDILCIGYHCEALFLQRDLRKMSHASSFAQDCSHSNPNGTIHLSSNNQALYATLLQGRVSNWAAL